MTRAQAARRWLFVLVAAGSVLAPLLRSAFFVVTFDDDAFIIDNPLVRSLSWHACRAWFGGFYHADYVPVTLASFALDFRLWGLWPGGYHLTNILLHLCASTLVAMLVGRLSRKAEIGLVAGALFALHPMQLETVAIISQRKTILSTIFALLALLGYDRYLQRRSPSMYLLVLACFVAGGLAKSSIITLPLLLLLCDWRGGRRPAVIEKLPFFAVAAGIAWLSVASKIDVGVIKTAHGGSRLATALLMGRVWLEYLLAFVFPARLSAAYYYRPSMAYSPWHAAALLAVVSGHLLVWIRRHRWPLTAFALFWFTAAMLPVANLVPIAVVRADRYVYLAMVGLVWWAAEGLTMLGTRLERRWPSARPAPAYAALLLLGCLTLHGTSIWRDDVSIWRRVVAVHPWNSRAHLLLGHAEANAGDLDEAVAVLQRSAALDPSYVDPHRVLAEIFAARGDLGQARSQARRVRQLAPRQPLPPPLEALLEP